MVSEFEIILFNCLGAEYEITPTREFKKCALKRSAYLHIIK